SRDGPRGSWRGNASPRRSASRNPPGSLQSFRPCPHPLETDRSAHVLCYPHEKQCGRFAWQKISSSAQEEAWRKTQRSYSPSHSSIFTYAIALSASFPKRNAASVVNSVPSELCA